MPRLVFISDTHGHHDFSIPEGDLLIHTGDLTMSGRVAEVAREAQWLWGVKTSHGFQDVIAIAGNHDWLFETSKTCAQLLLRERGITYLEDQALELDGLKFYGSPYTPEFCNWAFNVCRGSALADIWARIPDDTQILLTHGPPYGRFDEVQEADEDSYGTMYQENLKYKTKHVGCHDLATRVAQLKNLKVHAFGHIHRSNMVVGADKITYINSSICNIRGNTYQTAYQPIVLDL